MSLSACTRVLKKGDAEVRLVRTCVVEVVSKTSADAGKKVALEKPVFRVGTHPGNDLVLSDETVSAHHLEITVTPDGWKIVDLGSSNGTYAGTAKLGELSVVEPLELAVGKTTLRLSPTEREVEVPTSTRTHFGKVLGASVSMRELFEQLEAVAKSDASVLIEGETGVGKEVIAESLHAESLRAKKPFVVVDCSSLAEGLVEAELFGHARGAFTGAEGEREGMLEAARGGTVFLDEIGEMPLKLQAKLLGALERRQVRRLGESEPRAIDVRVIAATNRNLAREVNEQRFRADLFFRLSVVRLRVPPLRERLDDLPLLANALLDELRPRYGHALPDALSAVTLAKLAAQPWPGNVRELRNAVERVALSSTEDPVEQETYFDVRARVLDTWERSYFGGLIEKHGASQRNLARLTQLDRRYLLRILKRLGIGHEA